MIYGEFDNGWTRVRSSIIINQPSLNNTHFDYMKKASTSEALITDIQNKRSK